MNVESGGQHLRGIGARAASQFENGCPGRKQREKAEQPRMLRYLALGIGLRIFTVEPERCLIHETTPLRERRDLAGFSLMYRQSPASAAYSVPQRPRLLCPGCRDARQEPPGGTWDWQRHKAQACWSR